jgi:spore germination protein YaaH
MAGTQEVFLGTPPGSEGVTRLLIIRFSATILIMTLAVTLVYFTVDADMQPIHYRLGRSVAVWFPYWTDKDGEGAGWRDIQEHSDEIDEVSFFAFSADPNTGDLMNEGLGHGMSPGSIVSQVGWLHTRDVAALVTVTQFNHVDQMLSQPDRLKHLIDQIVGTCQTYGFDGVDIDFEDFKAGDPNDPAKFTDFIEQLSTAMHAQLDSFGFPSMVVATVLPHTDRGSFSFVDFSGLGKSDVDRIRVMAYDEYFPGSKQAGASAPAPWVASVGKYLATVDAPQWKFVLGIPGYGYRWPVNSTVDWTTTGKGLSVTYGAAQTLMTEHDAKRQWSDDQRTPYFSYVDGGSTWVGFYEDAESWQTKLQTVVLPSQMNGISEWAAGFEDPNSWTVVAANLAATKPIYGAVGNCYWRFGGGAKFGNAITSEQDAGPIDADSLNGRGGRQQQFQNGMFYYQWGKPRAYVVEDRVLTAYLLADGPSGKYGFPIADVVVAADGSESQQFENGTVTE